MTGPLHTAAEGVVELEEEIFGELAELLGSDGISDIIGSFRDETQARISRMTEACDTGNTVAIGCEAHSIKGAAATLGLAKFSTMAGHIEMAVKNGRMDGIAREIDTLRSCYDRSLAILRTRVQ